MIYLKKDRPVPSRRDVLTDRAGKRRVYSDIRHTLCGLGRTHARRQITPQKTHSEIPDSADFIPSRTSFRQERKLFLPEKRKSKMRRRITLSLLVLVLCFSSVLTSCGMLAFIDKSVIEQNDAPSSVSAFESESDPIPDDKKLAPSGSGDVSEPLFWKVSGNGYEGDFYLLGSIHVGLEDTNLYPDEIYDAYNSCAYLAVESDVISLERDTNAQIEMMKMFIYTDSTTISAHIDKDLYKTARGILDHFGYYNSMMDYYFPVIWSQIIDQALTEESRFSSDFGVDRYFLQNSEKLGIEILEIEDYMETEYAFATLSESTQELLLSSTVDPEYIKNYSSSLEELYDAWKYGKTDVLDDLLFSEDDEEATEEEKSAAEEYNNAMTVVRNKLMVERASEYLRDQKNVFYVVGLAHMLGDDGIVSSLENKGYTVSQISYAD